MSEDLKTEFGYIKGVLESLHEQHKDFRDEMRGYMEKDLAEHKSIREEIHKLNTKQAVADVKLGVMVAGISIAINQVINKFLGI